MIDATWEVGAAEGLFVAPEGAACFVAARKLVADGKIGTAEHVVIFNTGSGIKYLDCYDE
jgi:threonine synthase